MLDIQSVLRNLKRPDLLVKAARHGLDDYSRETHLRRILRSEPVPRPGPAIIKLLETEQELDEARIERRATYSVARHVEVLVAIMAEAQVLQASTRAK